MIEKSLTYSSNLILYLPRNTCINDLLSFISIYHDHLGKDEQMFIEIEEVIYGRGTFCLLVYTGELVRIKSKEISSYLYSLT